MLGLQQVVLHPYLLESLSLDLDLPNLRTQRRITYRPLGSTKSEKHGESEAKPVVTEQGAVYSREFFELGGERDDPNIGLL